ncbi:MAG: hypothetical protein ORN85_02770, partial [Sediminibacterium sp.]|nr:hypothetical protein [Sediminibacterium sp.]
IIDIDNQEFYNGLTNSNYVKNINFIPSSIGQDTWAIEVYNTCVNANSVSTNFITTTTNTSTLSSANSSFNFDICNKANPINNSFTISSLSSSANYTISSNHNITITSINGVSTNQTGINFTNMVPGVYNYTLIPNSDTNFTNTINIVSNYNTVNYPDTKEIIISYYPYGFAPDFTLSPSSLNGGSGTITINVNSFSGTSSSLIFNLMNTTLNIGATNFNTSIIKNGVSINGLSVTNIVSLGSSTTINYSVLRNGTAVGFTLSLTPTISISNTCGGIINSHSFNISLPSGY